MWLRRGDGTPVLVFHADTIARCLGDGWVEIPDPTTPTPPSPAGEPSPAFVAAVERKRRQAVHENNAAARAAFADMGMGPKPKGRR